MVCVCATPKRLIIRPTLMFAGQRTGGKGIVISATTDRYQIFLLSVDVSKAERQNSGPYASHSHYYIPVHLFLPPLPTFTGLPKLLSAASNSGTESNSSRSDSISKSFYKQHWFVLADSVSTDFAYQSDS